jgi:hypothetical protein
MRSRSGPTAHRSTYHFRVATDYGDAYSSQPWPGPRPGYQSQSSYRGPREERPPPGPRHPVRRRNRIIALLLLAAGAIGFFAAMAGVAGQVLPRRFDAAQQQRITDWEYAQRWRTLEASTIFPASVSYDAPAKLSDAALKLTASRVGVARQASCAAAADPSAARILDADGCTAMLRATYADGTDSYVVTVGAAVLPGSAGARAAAAGIKAAPGNSGLGPTVHAVSFTGTPAGAFSNGRRQLSGVVSAGSYVVLWAVGYADGRPMEPVAGDSYADGEMTSAGSGVARAVLSVLAAPVPPARCPGAPGC